MRAGLDSGTTIGDYTLVGHLGSGGMGTVYRARDQANREVALKVLPESRGPRAQQRFEREAQITACLVHPGIVRVFGAGRWQERPYIAYELVPGRSLRERLPDFSREEALRIVLSVSQAMAFAHERGVIHRDLKPDNILIDEAGQPKVADFGLATAADLERLTRSGALVGTPFAMAPEQISGEREKHGPATDVWALGVLLYRVLVGRNPFEGPTLSHLAVRIASGEFVAPRKEDPTISPALERVCLRALSSSVSDRYPDAGALATALSTALQDDPPRTAALVLPLIATLGLAIAGVLFAGPQRAAPAQPARLATLPASSPMPTPLDSALRRRVEDSVAAFAQGSDREGIQILFELGKLKEDLPREFDAALCQAVFGRAGTLIDSKPHQALNLLDEAVRSGIRGFPTLAGSDLTAIARAKLETKSLEITLYARLILAAAMLDQSLTPRAVQPLVDHQPRLRSGSKREAWYGALVLWAEGWRERFHGKAQTQARDALWKALRRESCVLRPTCWANAASSLAHRLPSEAALRVLDEAERRDPRNPDVLFSRARALKSVDSTAACQAAESALELYSTRRSPSLNGIDYRACLQLVLDAQIASKRREEAGRTWKILQKVFPVRSEKYAKNHPWLDPQAKSTLPAPSR